MFMPGTLDHSGLESDISDPGVPPALPGSPSQGMPSPMSAHPDDGLEPVFAAPPNACDAHFHIFGPAAKYPHVTDDLRYQPPYAPLGEFLAQARRLGISRFVLVQPIAYGLDNSCMFDAMAELDPAIR